MTRTTNKVKCSFVPGGLAALIALGLLMAGWAPGAAWGEDTVNLALAGETKHGNTETQSAMTELAGFWGGECDEFRLKLKWTGERVAGASTKNLGRLESGYDWFPEDAWSPFVFVVHEQDNVSGLDYDSSGGAGIKHYLYRRYGLRLSLSLALLHKEFKTMGTAPLSTSTYSFRPKIEWKAGNWFVSWIQYYQQNALLHSDFKRETLFRLTYITGTQADLMMDWNNTYRSVVGALVQKEDTRLKIGVIIHL
ncbi:MAG: DUF481 domain-containing protein [Deltaproteobacteria bacterium]|nr:DUF481 domain-containing protein [Deltaproteobacteria bacterium]